MIIYSVEEYAKYLNAVVKTDLNDKFGSHLQKACKNAFDFMHTNLVQFSPSIKEFLLVEKVKQLGKNKNKDLNNFINAFEKVDYWPGDEIESVEFITNVKANSGNYKGNRREIDNEGIYKSADTPEELFDATLYNLKKLVAKHADKKCYVRIAPELTCSFDNSGAEEIGTYTRLLFAEPGMEPPKEAI